MKETRLTKEAYPPDKNKPKYDHVLTVKDRVMIGIILICSLLLLIGCVV